MPARARATDRPSGNQAETDEEHVQRKQAELRKACRRIRERIRSFDARLSRAACLSREGPRRIDILRACAEASTRWLEAVDRVLEPSITFDQFKLRTKAMDDATSALDQAVDMLEAL